MTYILAIVLATLGAFAALYEWTAVITGKVPTITRVIQAMPTPVEVGIILGAVLAILDHFWFGLLVG